MRYEFHASFKNRMVDLGGRPSLVFVSLLVSSIGQVGEILVKPAKIDFPNLNWFQCETVIGCKNVVFIARISRKEAYKVANVQQSRL